MSRYIAWQELLSRTFGEEVQCPDCGGRLRLIALVKKEDTIRAVVTTLHYPPGVPPAGPPKGAKASSSATREDDFSGSGRGSVQSTDWPEYPDGKGRWGRILAGDRVEWEGLCTGKWLRFNYEHNEKYHRVFPKIDRIPPERFALYFLLDVRRLRAQINIGFRQPRAGST